MKKMNAVTGDTQVDRKYEKDYANLFKNRKNRETELNPKLLRVSPGDQGFEFNPYARLV